MRDMRINCSVTRGEIDNTLQGVIIAKLWICDEETPLVFELEGDCLRDLAGCHIAFSNNQHDSLSPLGFDLGEVTSGVAGEVTASARLFTFAPQNGDKEFLEPCYTNVMRLEFFTAMGRVIFESLKFDTKLLSLGWSMSEEEEFAQKAANFSAWQAHINSVSKRSLHTRIQELSYLYDEISQRFGKSLDFDQYEASLMGWDGILSALADERDANPSSGEVFFEGDAQPLLPDHLMLSGTEEEPFETHEWSEPTATYPVLITARDLIHEIHEYASQNIFPTGRHYKSLVHVLGNVESGLNKLLNSADIGDRPSDVRMMGCLESLGKMMVAFYHISKIIEVTEALQGRRILLNLRDGMLELREEISALRYQLHNL